MLEKLENPAPLVIKVETAELDLAYSDRFSMDLLKASGVHDVIVDLSGVTYMDSTCLSKLIALRKARSAQGLPQESLVICSPSLHRVLTIVGLINMWPLFRSLDDAIAATALP